MCVKSMVILDPSSIRSSETFVLFAGRHLVYWEPDNRERR